MVFNRENLINCLKELCPKEYELKYYEGVAFFENKGEETINKIAITFAEYFPHSATFTGISITIEYSIIENSICQKSNQLGLDYSSATSIRLLVEKNLESQISGEKIESEDDFIKVKPRLVQIIENNCLPLIDKYQKFNETAKLLSDLKPQEVVPYIQGAQLFVKTILILKEAGHPKYDKKRDEFYEVLKKQAAKKEVYSQQLKLFEALFY